MAGVGGYAHGEIEKEGDRVRETQRDKRREKRQEGRGEGVTESESERGDTGTLFPQYALASEVTEHHFYCTLLGRAITSLRAIFRKGNIRLGSWLKEGQSHCRKSIWDKTHM